jgi:ABC-type phosphate transport system substrate-binding protein
MNNRRAKLMASATVLGLGALGGVAMSTNQGIPPTQQLAANGSSAVVTSASGAVAQPVATTANTRAPIVTRASGGGLPVQVDD